MKKIQQRFVMVIVAFLGVVNTYLMRNSLGLVMTKLRPKDKVQTLAFTTKFTWSSKLQSLIHASFYIGYVLGHVPGAYLAERCGGKIVLNLGLLSTAIFTLLTPFTIEAGGAYGLIAMRFLMGLGEAPAFPALGSLLSAWVPIKERTIISAFVLGGVQIGSLLSNLVAGEVLVGSKGWGDVFFVVGGVGLAWNLLFQFTVYSTPDTHPRISDEEKEYLKKEIQSASKSNLKIPWSSLLTSPPVWALIVAQLGHDWGLFFLSSYIPKYLRDSLRMTFQEAGRYSALAYFVAWIISLGSGAIGGYIIERRKLNRTQSRKLFAFLSSVLPGVFIVLASYSDKAVALLCIIFSIGSMGAFYAGNRVNVLDVCPNFTASLLGLVNGLGAIGGIIALFSTGLLTPKNEIHEWRIVFWLTLVVLLATAVVYVIWASGEIQSWNNNTEEDNWLRRLYLKLSRRKVAKTQIGNDKNEVYQNEVNTEITA